MIFWARARSRGRVADAMPAALAVLDDVVRETRPFAAELEPVDRIDPASLVIHSKQYRILGQLGEGGMGIVYRAYDPVLERDVALKVVKPELPGAARHRFRQEAVIGARLTHPNVVRVFDLGFMPDQGLDWFAMEYLHGRDLDVLISRARERHKRLPWGIVAHVFSGLLDALEHAHLRGIVHRDVKPSNVFVCREPDEGRIATKLLDFGVAYDMRKKGGPLEICGDPRYIAPEQALGNRPLDARTDLYAAGLTLFELITGQHAFADLLEAPSRDLLAAQCERAVPRPSERLPSSVPAVVRCGLDVIVARACDKDPTRRFASASDMRTALLHVLRGA
jgi:serine/threonine protein kinase